MNDGCCCGVDGYRDFLKLGMEIPEYYKCTLPGTSRSRRNGIPTCYGKDSVFCDNVPEYNETSSGGFRCIVKHIQHDQKQIHVTKMIMFMSVSTGQLILVILAMVFTFRSAHAPTKLSCDNSNSSVKFDPLLEPANTKEDASSDAA